MITTTGTDDIGWFTNGWPATNAWPSSLNVPLFDMWAKAATYKPGWRFSVSASGYQAADSFPTLAVWAAVIDSNTGDPLPIQHSLPLPAQLTERSVSREEFYDWLFDMVMLVEHHEAREFFRVNGARWVDPHRDNNTRLYQ